MKDAGIEKESLTGSTVFGEGQSHLVCASRSWTADRSNDYFNLLEYW